MKKEIEKLSAGNKVRIINIILLIGFFIIFSSSLISSQYAESLSAYTQSQTYIPQLGQAQLNIFDQALCGTGQDFIVQVSPLGCTPVVRSDLLSSQDVPVFCPIVATKLNPLIDVKAINGISFVGGNYPSQVAGVGYQPARAAIIQPKLQTDSPVFNDLGYAVVFLRRQPNESAIPSFVQGNLTVRMNYNIQQAFGVGRAAFYLPDTNDNQWQLSYTSYSFWNGRGYIRAKNINDNSAEIEIYSDREAFSTGKTGDKRLIASVPLQLAAGKDESQNIPLPGFNFCFGSMTLKLQSIDNPGTRALLNVNGNQFEVKQGQTFLDDISGTACTVENIEKSGAVEKVSISCATDQGRQNFDLDISPKINLSINVNNQWQTKDYAVGDMLYSIDSEKNLYLGYIGTTDQGKIFIVPVVSTAKTSDEFKNTILYKSLPAAVKTVKWSSGNAVLDFLKDSSTTIFGGVASFLNWLDTGSSPAGFVYEDGTFVGWPTSSGLGQAFNKLVGSTDSYTNKFKINGFSSPVDVDLSTLKTQNPDFSTNYDNALKDYQTVSIDFSLDQYNLPGESGDKTLGQQALENKIDFMLQLDQKKTMLQLCNDFKNKYSASETPSKCNDLRELSSTSHDFENVVINQKTYTISLEEVREPSLADYNVQITVQNNDQNDKDHNGQKTLGLNDRIYLDKGNSEYVTLTDLQRDYATFDVSNVKGENGKILGVGTIVKIKLNSFEIIGSNKYRIDVNKININKVAVVTINPKINFQYSNATFNFKIGIEKRRFTLTPEQTKNRVATLNKTIDTIENIDNTLGKVVEAGKAACFATDAVLTVKNFISNLQGTGIARQLVMKGINGAGGWDEFCRKAVGQGQYGGSIDKCLLDNSDKINNEVNIYTDAINKINTDIKTIQDRNTIKNGFLQEDVVNTNAFLTDFVSTYKNEINIDAKGKLGNQIQIGNTNVNIDDITNGLSGDLVNVDQARNILLYSRLLNSNDAGISDKAKQQLTALFTDFWNSKQKQITISSIQDKLPQGLKGGNINVISDKETQTEFYGGDITTSQIGDMPSGTPYAKIYYKGVTYILGLQKLSQNYGVTEVYDINGIKIKDDGLRKEIKSKFIFEPLDPSRYQNQYSNPEVRYYETDPYKGLPQVVPFDLKNGWYAATQSTLPIGGSIKAFDESGRVSSIFLCNVGKNGLEEFNGAVGGDDSCEMINLVTNQPINQFPNLDSTKASELVKNAVNAIAEASKQYRSGVSQVTISGAGTIKVGPPATGIPAIQCQDFMSPSDCNILFNVCDPVMCPASRCNFGGKFNVADVVQSGVVGSIALCLPNAQEGIVVPICVSGVQAGLDAYNSVLKSYRQCLQTSLTTGQQVGICDQLNSVYMCELYWREATPIINYGVPALVSSVVGQGGTRGGGEYLTVSDAWKKVTDSINYFTQSYATSSFKAFQQRTTQEVGTEFCKKFISIVAPGDGSFFKKLIAPDSPPQFYANFQEIPYTTATNPPLSQYKVYYHIYAGKDLPAYYQVYLRGTGSSFYQDVPFSRVVDSGFIAAGDSADQTKNFIAPSDYKELCVSINGKEDCGFKQVTTDFGINYLSDKYVASQASTTGITTASGCVSGTPNLYALANLNVQAGAENVLNPVIYNEGITRVCATDNPGSGTDPSRWQEVGYCDNEKLKCWLDKQSVTNAIKAAGTNAQGQSTIAQQALQDAEKNALQALNGVTYMDNDAFDSLAQQLTATNPTMSATDRITTVNKNLPNVFYSFQKGFLTLLRGNAFKDIAVPIYRSWAATQQQNKQSIENYASIYSSPVFEYDYGGVGIKQIGVNVFRSSVYYRYFDKKWRVSETGTNWYPAESQAPISNKIDVITNDLGKTGLYTDGLNKLMYYKNANTGGGVNSEVALSTKPDYVDYLGGDKKMFRINTDTTGINWFFEYDSNVWKWSCGSQEFTDVSQTTDQCSKSTYVQNDLELARILKALNLPDNKNNLLNGAAVIFSYKYVATQVTTGTQGGTSNVSIQTTTGGTTQQVLLPINVRIVLYGTLGDNFFGDLMVSDYIYVWDGKNWSGGGQGGEVEKYAKSTNWDDGIDYINKKTLSENSSNNFNSIELSCGDKKLVLADKYSLSSVNISDAIKTKAKELCGYSISGLETSGTQPTTPQFEDRKNVSYNFSSAITESQMIDYINKASQGFYINRTCFCGDNCASFAKLILNASNKYNIPDPVLLLSLMMQESSCKIDALSGSSYGLMQISTWQDCQSQLGLNGINDVKGSGNVKNNIDCGAIILKKKYDLYNDGKIIFHGCSNRNVIYYNWEAAVRGYNGLGCDPNYPEQDFFVEQVMQRFQCLKGEISCK